jgi:hypothetical protein
LFHEFKHPPKPIFTHFKACELVFHEDQIVKQILVRWKNLLKNILHTDLIPN